MILILHEGREQLVNSLAGYEDAEVIAKNIPNPPCDTHWCKWVNGAWVVDDAAKIAAEENARVMSLSRAELVAEAQKGLLDDLVAAGIVSLDAAQSVANKIAERGGATVEEKLNAVG